MGAGNASSFLRPEDVLRRIGLRAEQTFVHLGCGAGFWLIPAAKIVGTGGKAIGIDIRPDMLSEVENRGKREHLDQVVRTLRGDLEHGRGSKLEDGVADVILIANIVHQVDPVKLLAEGKRLLKTGGHIIVVEWDVAASPIGPPPSKRIPEPDMRKIVEGSGISVKESFDASPYHYGLILEKSH